MRLMPARTAVCTAADIECDLPVPRAPEKQPAPIKIGRRQWCIARGKDPVLGRVIAQSSYQLIGFLWGHLVDVLAQLVHALNFMQKAISHCRRPFYDFAFGDAIFLASYIIDERADFLGRQQHVAFLGGIDHSAIADDIVRCRSASAATGRNWPPRWRWPRSARPPCWWRSWIA